MKGEKSVSNNRRVKLALPDQSHHRPKRPTEIKSESSQALKAMECSAGWEVRR